MHQEYQGRDIEPRPSFPTDLHAEAARRVLLLESLDLRHQLAGSAEAAPGRQSVRPPAERSENCAPVAVAHSASAAQQAVERLFGVPTIAGSDGKIYLAGHVSNVPEVSRGIQSPQDLSAMAAGLAAGAKSTTDGTVRYLSRANAVNETLVRFGPALDTAVDYWRHSTPAQVAADARLALASAAQSVESTFGRPLSPRERGRLAGEILANFLPLGGKGPRSGERLETLAGARSLDRVAGSSTDALGIERAGEYKWRQLRKQDLGLDEHFHIFEGRKSMQDGILTVSVDWLRTDGQANPYRLIGSMSRLAGNEGAHTLRIESAIINPRLMNSPALRRFGKVTEEGNKTVMTIPLCE